jgi:EmrB/QacA subfamily drug resistance transporter
VRRRAVAAVLLGTFIVFLDTSIIAIALPSIADDLGATTGIEWAVSVYLLALGVAQLTAGWLADRFGTRRAFLAGVGGFAFFSLCVAAAPNLVSLVALRAAQGLAGGLIIPLGAALMFTMFPPERRGTAVGASGTVIQLAPLVGLVLGGWIVTEATWRWVLLLELVLGGLAVAIGRHALPDVDPGRVRRFDVTGFSVASLGLVAILVACSQADEWGLGSPAFVATLATGAGLIGVFVVVSWGKPAALIDLTIFRSRTFSVCMVIVCVVAVAQFARAVFIPLELQTLRGLSALETGLLLVPAALTGAAVMPLGGRWVDRAGGRGPVIGGLVVTATATFVLGQQSLDTPLWLISVVLAINGMGIVLVTVPTTVVALSSVREPLVPQASAVRSLTREVAGSLGTALLATIIAGEVGVLAVEDASPEEASVAMDAYNRGFVVATCVVAAGAVLALLLPRGPAHALASVEARHRVSSISPEGVE